VVTVEVDAVVAFFEHVRAETERSQPELDRLDAIAGDGDHGVTMVVGWRAVCATLADADDATPGQALRRAAEAFADVGGSAGPLWGTALLRAGRALGDTAEVDLEALASAAAAATTGMEERGRCARGDCTVVDAMAPAADALGTAAGAGLPICDALRLAAEAAAEGAAATARLTPRRGRAARAPDRVRGHEDAGARAAAVFWAVAAARTPAAPGDGA
jgi:phosphoenolpyruvate---glycerone phosphotransferase subunit DhaL